VLAKAAYVCVRAACGAQGGLSRTEGISRAGREATKLGFGDWCCESGCEDEDGEGMHDNELADGLCLW
jgi:hypothetical protein